MPERRGQGSPARSEAVDRDNSEKERERERMWHRVDSFAFAVRLSGSRMKNGLQHTVQRSFVACIWKGTERKAPER